MHEYNLIDESWIPCAVSDNFYDDGNANEGVVNKQGVGDFGLRQIIHKASRIREINGDTPLVTVALHRLLLAVLHRLFGPKNANEWERLWNAKTWDADAINNYFDQHKTSFNLFDNEKPFYQTSTINFEQAGSIAKLRFQADANPTLFDHNFAANPPDLTPAEAARTLIAFQSFDFGGTKTGDGKAESADASPLIQCAVGLVRGRNLFETLMLNLHRYDAKDGEPFEFKNADKDVPAWERIEPVKAEDREPNGYIDLLTWQSRRVRLQPSLNRDDNICVKHVVIMKGNQFPDGFQLQGKETMVAFKGKPDAKPNERAWFPLGFNENKVLWRDSYSLFKSLDGTQLRPRMLNWLSDLAEEEILNRAQIIPIDFYGLAADRAKLLFWRHERFFLALPLLTNDALLNKLGDALKLAEEVATVLSISIKKLAQYLMMPDSDDSTRLSKQASASVQTFASSFNAEAFYWARLDTHFKALLVALPEDKTTDVDDNVVYGGRALPEWAQTLGLTAQRAFEDTERGLDSSGQNMKAAAKARAHFNRNLAGKMKEFSNR
jgi:CRISPR system Cascade subunit CasA